MATNLPEGMRREDPPATRRTGRRIQIAHSLAALPRDGEWYLVREYKHRSDAWVTRARHAHKYPHIEFLATSMGHGSALYARWIKP